MQYLDYSFFLHAVKSWFSKIRPKQPGRSKKKRGNIQIGFGIFLLPFLSKKHSLADLERLLEDNIDFMLDALPRVYISSRKVILQGDPPRVLVVDNRSKEDSLDYDLQIETNKNFSLLLCGNVDIFSVTVLPFELLVADPAVKLLIRVNLRYNAAECSSSAPPSGKLVHNLKCSLLEVPSFRLRCLSRIGSQWKLENSFIFLYILHLGLVRCCRKYLHPHFMSFELSASFFHGLSQKIIKLIRSDALHSGGGLPRGDVQFFFFFFF